MALATFIASILTPTGLAAGSRILARRQYRTWHRTAAPKIGEK
jgi:hypothetical protein